MSMSASITKITRAEAHMGESHTWVWVYAGDGSTVAIFLPAGTAQSVADAINAAVKEGV